MKLDRNIQGNNGRGKYALIKLRNLQEGDLAVDLALEALDKAGLLDWGIEGTESEFFVMRLKDKYAGPALSEYARVAGVDENHEYSREVHSLAERAGVLSPWCQRPD